MMRAFNAREGLDRKDNKLPEKLFTLTEWWLQRWQVN
jgi:hypothetical protein